MNLQTMDYFVAVAEERSFTRAAERLHVSQQALSAHIASVERELGVRLIERTVPLKLTYGGERFLYYARRFQAAKRAIGQEFRDIAGNQSGRLRVGVTATRGHIIMPRSIAMFRQAHPKISIALEEGENDQLVEALSEGRLDLIVATVPERAPGLVVRDLFLEEVVLLVSQALLDQTFGQRADEVVDEVERSSSLAAFADCPFMLMGERDVPGELARRAIEASGITPRLSVASTNSETLMALALRGVGACFIPSELVATNFADPEGVGMRVIHMGRTMTYQLSVAWRDSAHVWSAISSFAEVLIDQFSDGSRVSA